MAIRQVRLTWNKDTGRYARNRKRARVERFLRGPVPLSWLTSAAQLPGSALTVGVVLWHVAGLRGTHQHLPLSNERLKSFGVSRFSKDRALGALLSAGLVSIRRKRGRSPQVSLLTSRPTKHPSRREP
jgi:DNA-binding transcriptional ArsR family regulator